MSAGRVPRSAGHTARPWQQTSPFPGPRSTRTRARLVIANSECPPLNTKEQVLLRSVRRNHEHDTMQHIRLVMCAPTPGAPIRCHGVSHTVKECFHDADHESSEIWHFVVGGERRTRGPATLRTWQQNETRACLNARVHVHEATMFIASIGASFGEGCGGPQC